MKIIRHMGELWRFITCPHCRSHLEIENGDVAVREQWDGEDGVNIDVASVQCAVCNRTIDYVFVPAEIKQSAFREPSQQR
jgi:hypothetical protein